jgi:four helix bundle protein
MFDFEKLVVYQKAKLFNKQIYQFISTSGQLDRTTKDQFRRASFSIMLNIAEGASRFSKEDRRHFYVVSRGSVFECVAIVDFLKDVELIDDTFQQEVYKQAEELSKMLFSMIRSSE